MWISLVDLFGGLFRMTWYMHSVILGHRLLSMCYKLTLHCICCKRIVLANCRIGSFGDCALKRTADLLVQWFE